MEWQLDAVQTKAYAKQSLISCVRVELISKPYLIFYSSNHLLQQHMIYQCVDTIINDYVIIFTIIYAVWKVTSCIYIQIWAWVGISRSGHD